MLKPYLFSFDFEEQLYVNSSAYTNLAFVFSDSEQSLDEIENYCLTQVSLFEQRNADYYVKILSHELKSVHDQFLSKEGFYFFFEEDVKIFYEKGAFLGRLHLESDNSQIVEILVEKEDDFPAVLEGFPNYKLGDIEWLHGRHFVLFGDDIEWH
jgi:hypothetical protein